MYFDELRYHYKKFIKKSFINLSHRDESNGAHISFFNQKNIFSFFWYKGHPFCPIKGKINFLKILYGTWGLSIDSMLIFGVIFKFLPGLQPYLSKTNIYNEKSSQFRLWKRFKSIRFISANKIWNIWGHE